MKFIRRLYYLISTGKIIDSFVFQGSLGRHDQAWDYQTNEALKPYADRRALVGVFEWEQPDPEVEHEFATSYGVSVDVSGTAHKLVFDHTAPELPPAPASEAEQLMNIIKGVSP